MGRRKFRLTCRKNWENKKICSAKDNSLPATYQPLLQTPPNQLRNNQIPSLFPSSPLSNKQLPSPLPSRQLDNNQALIQSIPLIPSPLSNNQLPSLLLSRQLYNNQPLSKDPLLILPLIYINFGKSFSVWHLVNGACYLDKLHIFVYTHTQNPNQQLQVHYKSLQH